MTVAVLLVSLVLMPSRWRDLTLLAAAVLLPTVVALAAVTSAVLWGRRRPHADPFDELVFLRGVAAELQSGSSLRHALSRAASRTPELPLGGCVDAAMNGEPMEVVAARLGSSLPTMGEVAAATVTIGSASGGNLAGAFTAASAAAADELDVQREIAAATAGVRASVVVVAGLPVLAFSYLLATGSLGGMLTAGSIGATVAILGLTLLILGGAVTLAIGRTVPT